MVDESTVVFLRLALNCKLRQELRSLTVTQQILDMVESTASEILV